MDIQDYYLKVANRLVDYEYQNHRVGQVYFTVLQEVRPDLIELVVERDVDPFYDNQKLPAFKNLLIENW